MDNVYTREMSDYEKKYVEELTKGLYTYLNDHMDQNIAGFATTLFNVLVESMANFIVQVAGSEEELVEVMCNFVRMLHCRIMAKVEFYEE